ncbi:hypothetical protein SNK04_013784 [Fusarium graminearum]
MREQMTDAQKVEIVNATRECVNTGGDVRALADRLCKKYPQHWDAIIAGVDYSVMAYRRMAEREAAQRAERVSRLGEDLAVVEELIKKLPGVLARLRAAELDNGR